MLSRRVIACLFALVCLYVADAADADARQSASPAAQADAGRKTYRPEAHQSEAEESDNRSKAFEPEVSWSEVQIEFKGNRLFTSEQLLSLTKQCLGRFESEHPTFNSDLLDWCLNMNVRRFMYRSGYVRAKFGEPQIQKLWPGVKVTISVEEGELYRLGEIKIEGAEFFTAKQLRKQLPLKKGEIADSEAVTKWLCEHLKKEYGDNGFVHYDYDVEPEYKLDPGAKEGVIDLAITINEGKQFILRKVEFKGSGLTPEDALHRAMLLKEGEPFSAQKFRDSIAKLNDLDLFARIDVEVDSEFRADEETGDLEITIRMTGKGQEKAQVSEEDQEQSQNSPANPQERGKQFGKPRLVRRH
ncbi:MAG: hypothetical protein H0X14_11755 [Acidobacteria bacterium]|nr:hypothetical protein [Acidobacteriota bacterium]